MKYRLVAGALALAVVVSSGPALADDPKDPVLSKSAAARARDKAIIRQLNINELKRVRARDAHYAKGWDAYRAYPQQREAYQRELDRHREDQQDYARRMAAWREAVRRCNAGQYRYCD